MKASSGKYSQLFDTLTDTINSLIHEVNSQSLQYMATEEWTVKDVLSHLTFWHSYYAQNYLSLSEGTVPFVYGSKGGSTLNQEGVDKFKKQSKQNLIDSLNKANRSLYKSIVIREVPKMSYKVGREYQTEDFLEMITRHIKRHTMQIKRAKTKARD